MSPVYWNVASTCCAAPTLNMAAGDATALVLQTVKAAKSISQRSPQTKSLPVDVRTMSASSPPSTNDVPSVSIVSAPLVGSGSDSDSRLVTTPWLSLVRPNSAKTA